MEEKKLISDAAIHLQADLEVCGCAVIIVLYCGRSGRGKGGSWHERYSLDNWRVKPVGSYGGGGGGRNEVKTTNICD